EVLFGRLFAEVVAFYPERACEGETAHAGIRVVRVGRRLAGFTLAFRVVGDDELERVEHGDGTRCNRIEVVAQRLFKHAVVDAGIGLGDAQTFTEQPDGAGCVTAATQAGQRGQARVVPARDVAVAHQLQQLALAGDDVTQVEAGDVVELRTRFRASVA